jgi:D-beta-D-heptose 7-phosphate kinase / D-beta-D-heptose 1-phosphate adenosyltransferase
MKDRSRLMNWIEKFSQARVLTIGDVMLDRFAYGQISRISPEAPVPVLRSERTALTLGGAGNVVRNLHALGSRVSFVSVVGADSYGHLIQDMLLDLGIRSSLVVEQSRGTTVKTRFIAGQQQVLRVDEETTRWIEETTRKEVLKRIRDMIDDCDIVLLSDYRKGLLCQEIIQSTIEFAKASGKGVLVDPKGEDFTRYQGASILTPNAKELHEATLLPVDSDVAVVHASRMLIQTCHVEAIVATRGSEGLSLITAADDITHLRAEAREVFDVSGAGDTVIAVVAAAVGAGATLPEAAELANVAAGIVVGKVGTAVVYPRELIQILHHREFSRAEAKVLSIESALELVGLWRLKGYRIGFTNGIFDLLHHGHLSLFSQVSQICDRLIVGLNGDMSVRKLKGDDSLQNETTRSAILASLELVDMVVIFDEDTPMRLLEALQPDMLIKGANYRIEEVVGGDFVRHYGGEVVLADVADIYATNSTIARMTKGIF